MMTAIRHGRPTNAETGVMVAMSVSCVDDETHQSALAAIASDLAIEAIPHRLGFVQGRRPGVPQRRHGGPNQLWQSWSWIRFRAVSAGDYTHPPSTT